MVVGGADNGGSCVGAGASRHGVGIGGAWGVMVVMTGQMGKSHLIMCALTGIYRERPVYTIVYWYTPLCDWTKILLLCATISSKSKGEPPEKRKENSNEITSGETLTLENI